MESILIYSELCKSYEKKLAAQLFLKNLPHLGDKGMKWQTQVYRKADKRRS